MGTAHEEALEEAFERRITGDPQWALVVAEARQRLIDGFYPPELVSAVFSKWAGRPRVTLVDAYGFLQVWVHYLKGQIGTCSVPVDAKPLPDRCVAQNQEALDRLPSLFKARFEPGRGRSANDDGSFTWTEEISLRRRFVTPDTSVRDEPWWFVPEHSLALEVGTTSASKTLLHLRLGHGVARWPYGSKTIVVLATHPSLREWMGEA